MGFSTCKRNDNYCQNHGLNFVFVVVSALLLLMNTVNTAAEVPVVVRREPELSATIVRHRRIRVQGSKRDLLDIRIQSNRRIREIPNDKDSLQIVPSSTRRRADSTNTTSAEETIELKGIEVTPTNENNASANKNDNKNDNNNSSKRTLILSLMIVVAVVLVSLVVCLFMRRYKKKQNQKSVLSTKTMPENPDQDADDTEIDTMHQEVL